MASHILWSLLNELLEREEERVWSRSTLYTAAGTLQMWSQSTQLHVCACEFTGHVSAHTILLAFLQPNIQNQREAEDTPSPFPSQHSPQNPTNTRTPRGHTIPSQGRGSRITFFINQFTPSLNTSPPKNEICEGKTAVSPYLKDPSTHQVLPAEKKTQTICFYFSFWTTRMKPIASRVWGRKACLFQPA